MKILRKERKNLLTKVKSQVETDPFLKLSVASREGQGFRAKKTRASIRWLMGEHGQVVYECCWACMLSEGKCRQ